MSITTKIILIIVLALVLLGAGFLVLGKYSADDIRSFLGKAPIVRNFKDTTEVTYDIEPPVTDSLINVQPKIKKRNKMAYSPKFFPIDSTKVEGRDSIDVKDSLFPSPAFTAEIDTVTPSGDKVNISFNYPERFFPIITIVKPADTTAIIQPVRKETVIVPQTIKTESSWTEKAAYFLSGTVVGIIIIYAIKLFTENNNK